MHPDEVVSALRAAYPGELPHDDDAAGWAARRRAVLVARVAGDGDAALAVSSGCAATGAARHRSALTAQAGLALARLDSGRLVDCTTCGGRLPFARLDAVADVVACAACRRASTDGPDTRWCR